METMSLSASFILDRWPLSRVFSDSHFGPRRVMGL